MGYYIEVPENKGKAQQIAELHGALILDKQPPFAAVAVEAPEKAIICVVDNGMFEAAGFAYDEMEFNVFARPDGRPKTWLIMDRNLACKLTGYEE